MPLPTDNPLNSLLSPSAAPSPYSPLRSLFGSGLNGPFGSMAPTSSVNALSSLLAPPAIAPHLWFYVIRRFPGHLE